jgi:hypothetical protein
MTHVIEKKLGDFLKKNVFGMENLLSLMEYRNILPYLISLVKTSITLIIISTIASTNQLHLILIGCSLKNWGQKNF